MAVVIEYSVCLRCTESKNFVVRDHQYTDNIWINAAMCQISCLFCIHCLLLVVRILSYTVEQVTQSV